MTRKQKKRHKRFKKWMKHEFADALLIERRRESRHLPLG